jgi:hypothetical protein
MVNTDELRGLIAKHYRSQARFAKEVLEITPNAFYLKMKRGVFGSDEMEKMIAPLHITDPAEIFFAKSVT